MSASTSNPSSAAPETQLQPGAWLDRYELLAPVATGGFGSVWLARLKGKRGFEKLVAIKVPRLNGDVSFQEMLLDEARIASSIEHDNVAKIIELGEQGEILFIVMEWIDGEPVSTLLRTLDKMRTKFPLPIALKIISDMCSAVHAAHELKGPDGAELGVVHRDISPQNMLITAQGTVKLIDFGIAKAKNRAAGDTTDGTLKGKIKYMAPEQALGRDVDRRTDVFALGAVLYRFLAGRAPYEAENEVATVHKLATGTPADPLSENFPKGVRDIVARSLSVVPSARYKTALDMHRAIDELGLCADNATVAAFVEVHLQDRLAKRKAAIDLAIKAAADRTADRPQSLNDIFPPPISSREGQSKSDRSDFSGPPSRNSNPSASQSVGAPTILDSTSNSQQVTLLESQPSKLRWLWALAVAIGAAGVIMIVLVTTRKPPPSTPTNAANATTNSVAAAPPEPPPSASPAASTPVVTLPPPAPSASIKPATSAPPPVATAPVAKPPVFIPSKPNAINKPRPGASAKPAGAPDFGY